MASWAATPRSAHMARTASSIAGGPQANTLASASRRAREQLGDEAAVPSRPVVGGHVDGAREERGRLRVGGGAEPEQNRGAAAEIVLEAEKRGGADAAAHEQWRAAGVRSPPRAQRSYEPELLPGREGGQAPRAGAHLLE